MISDLDRPRFGRFTKRGRVHVLRDERHTIAHTLGEAPPVFDDPQPLVRMDAGYLNGRHWALCGEVGAMGATDGISVFDDLDLCGICRKLWPGDPDKLFEHEIEIEQ